MSQPAQKLPAPPQTQEAVIDALMATFEQLPPQLQIAARHIVDHPREVGVQTMRSLATDAGVHPNSFVRLARELGFDGYESLRERFRDFVRGGTGSSPDRARWLQSLAREGGASAVVGQMASACLDNVEQMFQGQQGEDLERAVEWILSSRRVFVLGLGLAYPLAYNFWYVSRMAFDHFVLIPRHGSLPGDDLVGIGPQDCLVAMTFQPYRRDTLEALRIAAAAEARTIGITDSPASPVCREAGLGLVAPTHTPQFFHSNAAVSALLETLCALLVAEGGERATAAIDSFQAARWEAGVYEE